MGASNLQQKNNNQLFDEIRQNSEELGEYWSARELQKALGYQS